MLWNPEFGVVKFFDSRPGKMFGFIKPDKPRKEGEEVFFHRNGGCAIIEDFAGELDLDLDTWIEREPHKGSRVVYRATTHGRGPVAFEWNYEDEWKKAQAIIARRPWPGCLSCRIIREADSGEKTVLWKGERPSLLQAISQGESTFLKDKTKWYHTIWCEDLRVQGWQRMWNPLDPSLSS